MPALQMKSKPITSLREEHSLHVCHKSTKVLKDISRSNRSQHPVVPNCEFSDECIKVSGVVDLRVCGGGSRDQSASGLPDLVSAGRTVSESPTVLETLFSPIIAYEDALANLTSERDAVVAEQAELPHLITDDSDEGSSSPRDLQSCDGSDYHVSDPNFSVCFNEEFGLPDSKSTPSDSECMKSEVMIDTEDGYIVLPYNEKTVEPFGVDYAKEEMEMNVDDSYLLLALHQLKSPAEEIKGCFQSTVGKEVDCLEPHLFIGNFPDAIEEDSPSCPCMLVDETRKQKPITLVLDLDETLVHSTLDHCEDADFTFPVFLNMKEHTVYVRQRPHLHAFLERVAEMFEVVIFTASQSIYAERLLDTLDPNKNLISRRMYRESCTFSGGSYTKDLSILGIDLARVAIIDNSPQVFQLQVNNGIPIKSWFDDPMDYALISLLPFLETLAEADDVRPLIAKKFNNKEEMDCAIQPACHSSQRV